MQPQALSGSPPGPAPCGRRASSTVHGSKGTGHTTDILGALGAVTVADSTPAVWYSDVTKKSLREAVWTGTAWRLRTLDGLGSVVSGHTTDALAGPVTVTAPYNLPNVAYFDAKTGALRDSYWNGGAWVFASVDGPGTSSPGRTHDHLGGAVVSAVPPLAPQDWYLDAHTGALRRLWWENTGWHAEIVDGPGAATSGATTDALSGPLAVTTANGNASVVYLDASTHVMREATWTGAGWKLSTVAHRTAVLARSVLFFLATGARLAHGADPQPEPDGPQSCSLVEDTEARVQRDRSW